MLKLVSGEMIICKAKRSRAGYKVSNPMIVEIEIMDMDQTQACGPESELEKELQNDKDAQDPTAVFLSPLVEFCLPVESLVLHSHIIMVFQPQPFVKQAYLEYTNQNTQKPVSVITDSDSFLQRNKRLFGFL